MGSATPSEEEVLLAQLGGALADAVEAALPGWVAAVAAARLPAGASVDVGAVAGEAAAAVLPDLRALLAADVDEQRQGPLAVVRRAAGPVTAALAAAGAEPVARDDHQRSLFPDDAFDVVPASFGDLSEEAGQAGIAWGAAKAFVHRRRHRG